MQKKENLDYKKSIYSFGSYYRVENGSYVKSYIINRKIPIESLYSENIRKFLRSNKWNKIYRLNRSELIDQLKLFIEDCIKSNYTKTIDVNENITIIGYEKDGKKTGKYIEILIQSETPVEFDSIIQMDKPVPYPKNFGFVKDCGKNVSEKIKIPNNSKSSASSSFSSCISSFEIKIITKALPFPSSSSTSSSIQFFGNGSPANSPIPSPISQTTTLSNEPIHTSIEPNTNPTIDKNLSPTETLQIQNFNQPIVYEDFIISTQSYYSFEQYNNYKRKETRL